MRDFTKASIILVLVTCLFSLSHGQKSNPLQATIDNGIVNQPLDDYYHEDFDDLTVGQGVADQLGWPWYAYWSPGFPQDAIVSDAQSMSPDNSFIVDDNDIDLIFMFSEDYNPIYSGHWSYSHYMYIPSDRTGYFNVQTDPSPGVGWNLELYFEDDGTGYFAQGSTESFNYPQDAWFKVELIYDFGSGYAQVLFNDEQIVLFENEMSIGAIDYYGFDVNGIPGSYYDDVCFGIGVPLLTPPTNLTVEYQDTDILLNWEPPYYKEDLLGYKIYHSFESGDYYELDYTTDTTYTHIEPLTGLHCYRVTAVYDIGESMPCEEACELIDKVDEYSTPVVQIYPNPAKEFIHISTKTEIRSIKVYDVTGILLYNKPVNNSTFSFSTSEFETGLYMFQVETSEGLFSEKVIIE